VPPEDVKVAMVILYFSVKPGGGSLHLAKEQKSLRGAKSAFSRGDIHTYDFLCLYSQSIVFYYLYSLLLSMQLQFQWGDE